MPRRILGWIAYWLVAIALAITSLKIAYGATHCTCAPGKPGFACQGDILAGEMAPTRTAKQLTTAMTPHEH